MTVIVLAEFADEDALVAAARSLDPTKYQLCDALTPRPIEAMTDLVSQEPSRIRKAMLLAGFGTAAVAYAVQFYSSVIAYPYNSGGRPLHSWPVFLLVPVEIGILAAAVCGMITFFMACDLPRLHHPFFDTPGVERASQDRYMLVAETQEPEEIRLRDILVGAGAVAISRAAKP